MKHPYMKMSFSLFLIFMCQSCVMVNSKNIPIGEDESVSYLCVSDVDTCTKAIITFFSSGYFVYREISHDIIGELCQYNKGIWHQKKDTVYLTTFFQNRIDDYIVDLGSMDIQDSILIYIYSLQTGKPTDDFAFINKDDSLFLPTQDGRLYVSCIEMESLARQLFLGITGDYDVSVSLECGRVYRYYIKDCFPIVLHADKYIVTDSCIVDMSTGNSYWREK